MTVKLKQDRSRHSGHKHSLNAQQYPQIPKTPALRRQMLREATKNYLALMAAWCEGRQAEKIARAAALNLIDTLDKEGK